MKNSMKKSLSIAILFTMMLMPTLIQAQSFADLVRQYEGHCSQIVLDTIEQDGVVSYDHVPVLDANGNIAYYALGSPDTTWNAPDCPDFKYVAMDYYIGRGIIWDSSSSAYNNNINIVSSWPLDGTVKLDQYKVKITRQYVCEVKLREVAPFSQDFWDWLKKQ